MYNMMVETLIIAFVMGGIMGAITAMHLAAPKKVRIEEDQPNGKHRQ